MKVANVAFLFAIAGFYYTVSASQCQGVDILAGMSSVQLMFVGPIMTVRKHLHMSNKRRSFDQPLLHEVHTNTRAMPILSEGSPRGCHARRGVRGDTLWTVFTVDERAKQAVGC